MKEMSQVWLVGQLVWKVFRKDDVITFIFQVSIKKIFVLVQILYGFWILSVTCLLGLCYESLW